MDSDLKLKIERYVNDIVKASIKECMADGFIQDNSITNGNEVDVDNKFTDDNETKECEIYEDIPVTRGGLERLAERLASDIMNDGFRTVTRPKKCLCVGIVCLDLITICEEYPDEDTEKLVLDHYWARGGNASNSATVLAHLGADAEFLGTIVNNRWCEFLADDFKSSGVSFENCVYLDATQHKSPVATLILSKATGTRTAFPDFRNVTELTLENFNCMDLRKYDWIHFEGRPKNPDIEKMMNKIETYNENCDIRDKIKVSVEMEQPHTICPELRPLFDKADVIFVSKVYAIDAGFKSKQEAAEGLFSRCKESSILVCAWGDEGAIANTELGIFSSPAFPPDRLVDTLGAGDTFNASVIYALREGRNAADAIGFGCRVAGTKCGMGGFAGVKGLQLWL